MTVSHRGARPRLHRVSWIRWTALVAVLAVSVVVALVVLWRSGVVEAPSAVRSVIGVGPKAVKLVLVTPPGLAEDQTPNGVRLAIDEVNAAGGIDGLPVVLKIVHEDAYTEDVPLEEIVEDTLELADKIASESDLLAVLGH